MKPDRQQQKEDVKIEPPVADLGPNRSAHASQRGGPTRAEEPSVSGLGSFVPTSDDGGPIVKPTVGYVGNEMVMMYGDSARVYHVTERSAAVDIQREGFLGGWGDCGFGLYVYSTSGEARDYAMRGGWDKSLKDPIVLVAHIPIKMLRQPELHPDWNQENYECVLWVPMNEEEEFETLHPELLIGWDALAGNEIP